MSVVDKRTNTLGSNLKHTVKERVNLDKDIFVNRKDFYNLFASAYITSKRPHAISSYKFLDIKERTKNAFYLEFCM